jgi:hypothetical protein
MISNFLSTEALAKLFLVQPPSIRSAYCRLGHYHGLRPTKLPNGRLLWPADAAARILTGEAR